MLKPEYTKPFQRDIKRLKRKHVDLTDLKSVIRLVTEDTSESKETLRRRHRAHRLQGKDWDGVIECHIGNAGDWLAIWIRDDGTAWFLRTGSHDEIFGS
ncbi:type II toxin-antitoxin system YafQ family toxin [Bifidobacterium sp. 64T4]|uniref:type II toxin-antitoxin system RelE/ParE family toxin n=1 Tax=Bifidobacterium pongonis TaxID=2834432 RepID=UPI001C583D9E|nr:type II toxin-antitoxin system mRNA interferase toxin, RelE/StbE family [Bifidobacterium pongonis]MBW3095500.1 type II toxin-antitoxin system YafQ family toxin [Bifidobacterium pongonis]